MQEYGGLHEKNDIKMLILFILREAKRPLSRSLLTDIAMRDGLVNYFLLCESFAELEESELLCGDEDGYSLTPEGTMTIALMENDLIPSVRDRVTQSMLEVLSELKLDSELKCEITEVHGGFNVSCTAYESKDILMSTTLYVPTRRQAEQIVRYFKANSEVVYRLLLKTLSGEDA